MKLYAFNYNPDVFESGDVTMSVHFTRKGAKKAMEQHKEQTRQVFMDANDGKDHFEFDGHKHTFDEDKNWYVSEFEVRD